MACQPPCLDTVLLPIDLSRPPTWTNRPETLDGPRQDWLFDTGSLTRRLTRLCADGLRVTPAHEGWATLREDECQVLGLPLGTTGWVREVYLSGNGEPWVFARSVAGQAALRRDGFPIAALGSRSLGELLFVNGGFSRGPIEVCRYPVAWPEGSATREEPWGRRSRFDRGDLALLVTEVFLPAFWAALPRPTETR